MWLKEHDARMRAEGRAETLASQVDSLQDVAQTALGAVQKLDSVAAQQQTKIAEQQERLRQTAALARKQTEAATSSLRESLDSSQKVMLDIVVNGYEEQLRAKDSLYAAQVRLTTLAKAQIVSRDSAYKALQQASNVVFDAWQVEKKRANPSFIAKAIRLVPVVATAVAVTLIADR